ncbi:amino acid ABC transporter substrate-binding protein [Breoghania sp.]|uniref:amino acid ABC transporter substrate-binding protein n=1 Tax=Breoghania sp. TaxID=2065378 RepID=UPI00262468FD|nr:amino acid ABC transporter substrate-binding protein [Breoghania sp.]MDJ0930581.1 amino acid ABC transporter substrate-binding protein [Breoghania sp.]
MTVFKNVGKAVLGAAAIALISVSAQAQDFTGHLAKIAENGVITLGYRDSSIPFSYLDENQKPVGYTMDICAKIVDAVAEKVGKDLKVNYVPVNPKTRMTLIANGTIDMTCGSATDTLAREQKVGFLPTIFVTGTKLLVKEGSGISSIDDLEGKSIALPQGTTNDKAIRHEIAKRGLNVNILSVSNHGEGFLALQTDRVDAYSTGHILLFRLKAKAKAKKPDNYAVVGDFLSFDPYGIMIPRDDDDFRLIGRIALADLARSG